MASSRKRPRIRIRKQRTEIQQAIITLRRTRGFSQQDLATYMHHNTATIGRWEAITPPHGLALVELAKVAHAFGRTDLAEIFSQAVDLEASLIGGLGGYVHRTGFVTLTTLEFALKDLYECAHADSSRRSPVSRAYQRALKAIAAAHHVLVQEAAQGRVLKLQEPGYRQHLERIQLQIETMYDQEASEGHALTAPEET
jgi:hypothetical protein